MAKKSEPPQNREPKNQEMTTTQTLSGLLGITEGQATDFFRALDKMNLAVLDRRVYDAFVSRKDFTVDILEQTIQEFIRAKVKKPNNLINFFPARELADEIVSKFKTCKEF